MKRELTHRERMLTALEGGVPDRLPATIHGWMDYWNNKCMNGADQFGDQIMLMGCIDTQLIIETNPDLVRAETRRVLDIMKPGGGYVASPSHDYVLPETPVENVLSVYEIIREYGGYN